ncbi:DNA ligase [Histoplasma capsulatum G186AR]|uniref:DNA ligase n=2 Tax=Ajellomyces capsulatus TaxID=5037 RepID=C0NW53_AJECG|nr:DNA ligase [Histoplasma capsulatum G186AR]EEH04158.1 DNA ligase [Histoplasma capsulatum G186AR]KAG5291107.1 DNA ligase [Histoplasma capsulatum]QSS68410.1 DNA ligase [Histoplasma capsulatum G186AR]
MPSPAKKRKTNDVKPVPQRIRGIRSFFEPQNATRTPATSALLTDEELARKLQAEWNEEVRADHQSPSPPKDSLGLLSREANAEDRDEGFGIEPQPPALSFTDVPRDTTKTVLSLQTSSLNEDTISQSIPFDQSPLTFDPSGYIEQLRTHWAFGGGHASYAILTRAFVLVNNTQSRIKIVDTLANFLRVVTEADPDSLVPAVWLTTNAIAPPYVPLELGLGGSIISKALKTAYGLNNQGLKILYDKHGDAGDVAFEAKKRQTFTLRRPRPLSIRGVYESLLKISQSKGPGSQEAKQRIVEKLLQDTRGAEESRYLVRTLVQHLRIGAVKTTMLIALARAFLLSGPAASSFSVYSRTDLSKLKKEEIASIYNRAEEIVRACYARHPNYNDLIPCLLEVGISDELLVRCGLTLHIPLRPMLGSITRDLTQMLTKLQGRKFTCEYKYDGQRAQVHCDSSGTVSIFSRHLERMTDKYPDLVALIPRIRGEGVSSFILEGEIVAVNQGTGELLAFQTLTNRAKKNVGIDSIKISVCLFAFDLMFLNGEPLLERPLRERRELLRGLFIDIPHHFTFVKSIDATSFDSEAVLAFYKDALDAKCEGLMVKLLDDSVTPDMPEEESATKPISTSELPSAPASMELNVNAKHKGRRSLLSTYEPDKRLESWLKVKKDYSAASDTLDLIPIAAWHGQGRKAKWWSPILLAARNPETGLLEAVTKCISGFTDKFYQANKEKYAEGSENIISRPNYVEYRNEPEVWFEPQEVWEVAFADITLSPTYTAAIGLVSEDRGLSLRFPRFIKVREDKGIDEASSSEYLASLWRKQTKRLQEEGSLTKLEAEHDNFGLEDERR